MQPSSFTSEFGDHVPQEKQKYCLRQLEEVAAEIRTQGQRKCEIVCLRKSQLAKVGWALFQTHFSQLCKVVAVTGAAEARADAYKHPPTRD